MAKCNRCKRRAFPTQDGIAAWFCGVGKEFQGVVDYMDRLRGGIEDEWFKMERFKIGLNLYFCLEANLKDPTSFQALIQVCQGYDRQVKMMNSMGTPKRRLWVPT